MSHVALGWSDGSLSDDSASKVIVCSTEPVLVDRVRSSPTATRARPNITSPPALNAASWQGAERGHPLPVGKGSARDSAQGYAGSDTLLAMAGDNRCRRDTGTRTTAAATDVKRQALGCPKPIKSSRWRANLVLPAGVAILALTACGGSGVSAGELTSYVASVEPIRLAVNQLLNDADPILEAYRSHKETGPQAATDMGRLEQKFAAYTVDINALTPSDPVLASINAPYAHTYILEDAYLSALVAALPDGDFSTLPNTQAAQRASIIEWRVQLEVLARADHVSLPADLQQAGRGEIAPGVSGSS